MLYGLCFIVLSSPSCRIWCGIFVASKQILDEIGLMGLLSKQKKFPIQTLSDLGKTPQLVYIVVLYDDHGLAMRCNLHLHYV